jgi:hypothetical protein
MVSCYDEIKKIIKNPRIYLPEEVLKLTSKLDFIQFEGEGKVARSRES